MRPGACLAGIRSSAQVQAIVALQQDEESAEHAGTVAAGPAVQAAGVCRAVTWRGDKGLTQALPPAGRSGLIADALGVPFEEHARVRRHFLRGRVSKRNKSNRNW